MDGMTADYSEALHGETSTGDFSATESLPIRKASIEDLCGQRARALELYRQGYDLIEQARTAHARACVGASHISSFPHDRLRYYTAGEADKFSAEMREIVDRDMWRAFVVNTPLGGLMDVQERKKFEDDLKAVPPEATPDNVFATLQRLAGEAPMIFRRGLVNAFAKLCRDYKSHDGFKIGDRIVLSYVVKYEANCNWLSTGYRIEEDLKDIDRVMHVLDGKPAPEYQQGIVAALREAVSGWRRGGLMECETEYWRLKFFKNGNGHLFPKRKDLVQRANLLIAEHYGAVVGAAPDVATKKPRYQNVPENAAADFYPTPTDIVDQMIAAADLDPSQRVLEPSAGEGAIVQGIIDATGIAPVCVEIDPQRAAYLRTIVAPTRVIDGDFMDYHPSEGFTRALLNPPFSHGRDVSHILHARSLLVPGGRLVAICADGPRQNEKLRPLASSWVRLPPDTFKDQGTSVRTVMLTIDA